MFALALKPIKKIFSDKVKNDMHHNCRYSWTRSCPRTMPELGYICPIGYFRQDLNFFNNVMMKVK